MTDSQFTSKSTGVIMGIAALLSVSVWFLVGSNIARITTLSSLQTVGMGIGMGLMSLILVIVAKKVDMPRVGELFVSLTSIFLIVTMFAWISGYYRLALPSTIFAMALSLISYMGIMEAEMGLY